MHNTVIHLIRPELAADLKRFIYLNGFINIDATIWHFRRVVQLH